MNNSQNPKPQIPAQATLSFYKKGRKGSSEIQEAWSTTNQGKKIQWPRALQKTSLS